MLFPKAFWPAAPHFLRPVSGRYTFANLHALGIDGVLAAWVRPAHVLEVEVCAGTTRGSRQLGQGSAHGLVCGSVLGSFTVPRNHPCTLGTTPSTLGTTPSILGTTPSILVVVPRVRGAVLGGP